MNLIFPHQNPNFFPVLSAVSSIIIFFDLSISHFSLTRPFLSQPLSDLPPPLSLYRRLIFEIQSINQPEIHGRMFIALYCIDNQDSDLPQWRLNQACTTFSDLYSHTNLFVLDPISNLVIDFRFIFFMFIFHI
ncbi:hypothetical protein QVD17_05847 [Tagetes erecta]|uniref:Uncharacterized protein n=1 Tax=Tagetes erecta TaxID=13708 RepID=A0AAD8LKJ9_TARER|nr:hypothetical protein QVD17_05847 [Tagetes erecta]